MKKILRVFIVIQLVILLTFSTYSWFSDTSNPTISESELQVTTADGLVIKLTPDGIPLSEVALNQVIADYASFTLKQVSSSDADNFFTIDFGQGLSVQNPEFIALLPDEYGAIDMINYGYIDYDFYLATDNIGKSVYLHKDTAFGGPGADSLRLALIINDPMLGNFKRIFGTVAEGIYGYPSVTRAVYATGIFDYDTELASPTYTTNQFVYTFNYYNGGRGVSDTDPIDTSKLIINIPANSQVKVTMRIWLEGGDPDCTANLSGTTLNTVIKFGSANIQPAAPMVTVGNGNRITGLTTEMEYYVVGNNVWTAVVDPLMSFPTGATVWVRFPATQQSDASYVTILEF